MEHEVQQARMDRSARMPGRGGQIVLRVLALSMLVYVVVWSYSFTLAFLGPFGPIVFLLLVGLALLAATPALLARYRGRLRATGARVASSLWGPLRASGVPTRVARRSPRLSRFLRARFALDAATGLSLTIVLAVAAAVAWTFGLLLLEVVTGSSLLATDRRVINLTATLRTPLLDRAALLITFLGNSTATVLIASTIMLIGLLARRKDVVVLVPLALLASSIFYSSVKALVGRPRPLLETARIVQGGWSFPSGHATVSVALYGTLVYLLLRSTRSAVLRALVLVAGALIVLVIGLTRIYLGVHYPSDVLAGWTSGALWLAVVLAIDRVRRPRLMAPLSPLRRRITIGLLVSLLLLGGPYLFLVLRDVPPPPPATTTTAPALVAAADLAQALGESILRPSESLLGEPREPVSLLFAGTRSELERAFTRAGWTLAPSAGVGSLGRAVRAGLDEGAEPGAPVNPHFVRDQANTMAFARLSETTGVGARLVVRVWSTPYRVPPATQIWLATVGLEQPVRLAPVTLVPERPVVAASEADRDAVPRGLQAAGGVARVEPLSLPAGTPQPVLVWLLPVE